MFTPFDTYISSGFQLAQLEMAILPRPSQLRPTRVFPTPQMCQGGDEARFQPCTTEQGRDGFRLFRPTPPCSSLSSPCPALLRVIIVIFHILKPYYLNKHINISLFYYTQCDYLPLFCYVLYYEIFLFFFFGDCLVKHLDILFNFF